MVLTEQGEYWERSGKLKSPRSKRDSLNNLYKSSISFSPGLARDTQIIMQSPFSLFLALST